MPTKKRRATEARNRQLHAEEWANLKRMDDEFARLPERLKKLYKTPPGTTSDIAWAMEQGESPYLNLKGGLLLIDKNGDVGIRARGDKTGSANEERRSAKLRHIEYLQMTYPQHWLRRGGAKAIALSEKEKLPNKRALSPERGVNKPVSERTVQNYLKKMRKAKRAP